MVCQQDREEDQSQDPDQDLELIADLLEKLENVLEDAFAVGVNAQWLAARLSRALGEIAGMVHQEAHSDSEC